MQDKTTTILHLCNTFGDALSQKMVGYKAGIDMRSAAYLFVRRSDE